MNAQAPPLVSPNSSPVAGAVNAVANVAVNAANAVTNAASGAVNAVTNAANNMFGGPPPNNNARRNNAPANVAANAPANAPRNNAAANAQRNNAPILNSLIPLGNNASPPNTRANVGVINSPPTFQASSGTLFTPLNIFIGLVVAFVVIFSLFTAQIKRGYEYITGSFKRSVGIEPRPDVTAPIIPVQGVVREVTVPPSPPQNITPAQHTVQQSLSQQIVEKVLPSGGNVAQNKFSYYDAEPLCKALGAELATYEQVKDAWGKGADWCNYGWVKGQMAVFPTQKGTYDKLQSGPADEQNACGTTGINGGYFENPDMLYGVNCYGKKPSQSAHDQQKLMDSGKIPKSPETLKVDEMMRQFKSEAESTFVKPFSDDKWSSS